MAKQRERRLSQMTPASMISGNATSRLQTNEGNSQAVDRPDRALVVTPHPDDAEIGYGGTIAGWIAQGTEVAYVLCTNGDKGSGDAEMTSDRLAEIRAREQAEAADELGVKDVIYLAYPDGALEDTAEFRGDLVKAIRTYTPDLVLCPDPFRQGFYLHRDHRICGQVALGAVFPHARDHLHYPEHLRDNGLAPHKVSDVLLWGTQEPDTFVDIVDTIEQKTFSLNMHASQVSSGGAERDVAEFVKADAQRAGQRGGLPYAEAFRRIQIRR